MTKRKPNGSRDFEVKDLGNLRDYQGMEICPIKEWNFSIPKEVYPGCSYRNWYVDTPMDPARKGRGEEKSPPTNKDRYQSLVGELIYLTHTRPDIAFAVSMASRFMNNPIEYHMKAVNRILQSVPEGNTGQEYTLQKTLKT